MYFFFVYSWGAGSDPWGKERDEVSRYLLLRLIPRLAKGCSANFASNIERI